LVCYKLKSENALVCILRVVAYNSNTYDETEFTDYSNMTERFDKVDKALEVKTTMLGDGDRISDDGAVMGHQLERLDRWTHDLAKNWLQAFRHGAI